MSQSADIDAINDFVQRQKTAAASNAKLKAAIDDWDKWFADLSFWSKSMSDDTLTEAKHRRDLINIAAGAEDLVALGFKPADQPDNQLPLSDILGHTSTEITAAQKKKDAQVIKDGPQNRQPLIALGSKDKPRIILIQKILGLKQTGVFDNALLAAVKKYQTNHGIKPISGNVGPLTWTSFGIMDVSQENVASPVIFVPTTGPSTPAQQAGVGQPASAKPPAAKPPAVSSTKPPVGGKPPVGTTTIATTSKPPMQALQAGIGSMFSSIPNWLKVVLGLGAGGAVVAASVKGKKH